MNALPTLLFALLVQVPESGTQGWLGVYLKDAERPTVAETVPGSPAARARLQPGDVFLAVDDRETRTVRSFVAAIRAHEAGDRVTLRLRRRGEEVRVRLRLDERPDPQEAPPPAPAEAPARPFLGISLQETDDGLRVTRVLDGSPAARAGLRTGERLTRLAGEELRDLEDVDRARETVRPGPEVPVTLRGEEGTRTVRVTLGAAPAPRPEGEVEPAPVEEPPPVEEPAGDEPGAPEFGTDLAAVRKVASKSGRPVLLVFGASWSSSCHALKRAFADPALAGVLRRYERVWLDTDEHAETADRFGVQGLPHLVILDGEARRYQRAGFLPAELLRPVLERHAKGGAEEPRESEEQAPPEGAPPDEAVLDRVVRRFEELEARLHSLDEAQREQIAGLREEIAELRALVEKLRKRDGGR